MSSNVEDAVRRTVDECIEEGILRDFLLKHKREAIEVCIFEYDEEKAMRYIKEDEYDRGKKVGEEIGLLKGEEIGRIKIIVDFLSNGGSETDAKCMLNAAETEIAEAKKRL